MDYETKLMQARLDAIENVLLNLIGSDQRTLDQVRTMLSDTYKAAYEKQHEQARPDFQRTVHLEMRPPRDTAGEAAKTAAYERLCRKFGASL